MLSDRRKQGTPEISSYGKNYCEASLYRETTFSLRLGYRIQARSQLHRMRSVVRWPFGEVMKFFFRVLVLSFAGRLDIGSSILGPTARPNSIDSRAYSDSGSACQSRPDEDW